MNWAMPCAPAGETAKGSKPDSAESCAASSEAETFQRAAEASSDARKRAGTKLGRTGWADPAPSSPAPSTALPAAEHGGGPPSKPKCHGSQDHRRFRHGLLPALVLASQH